MSDSPQDELAAEREAIVEEDCLLHMALDHARCGKRIFPCDPKTKEPYLDLAPHWSTDATTDTDTIKKWWDERPGAAIGWAIPRGVIVIDADLYKPGCAFADLEKQHGKFPHTVETETPGNGTVHGHYYAYDLPPGTPKVRTGNNALGQAVDVKGDGDGYVMLAGSPHWTGGRYTTVDTGVTEREIAPDWIVEAVLESNLSDSGQPGRVPASQRFTRRRACPVCGGGKNDPPRQGVRCYGFLSSDGRYAHCTREERAGGLPREASGSTYAHRLEDECKCGQKHAAAAGRDGTTTEGEPETNDSVTAGDSTPEAPAPAEEKFPTLAEDAYHGIAGEIVKEIEPETEADPAAILAHLVIMVGNAVGPTPCYRVEANWHRANLYALIVGRTHGGRKGTAEGQARRIVEQVEPSWGRDRIMGGLSTGEGLINAVRDLTTQEIEAGITPPDPRLLAIESEFARTLGVMARKGDTLYTVMRQAWDGLPLRVLTRHSPLRASNHHISIIGHITPDELIANVDQGHAASGFLNRFLFFRVRRSKLLPSGGCVSDEAMRPLRGRLERAVEAARTDRPERTRDADAAELWDHLYRNEFSADRSGIYGDVTARAAAQVVRLSLIYALLDQSQQVGVPHLKAGLAVWRFSAESAKLIFGDLLGNPVANRILGELRAVHPQGIPRSELSRLLGGHCAAAEFERALMTLSGNRLAVAGRAKLGNRGRPAEWWFAL